MSGKWWEVQQMLVDEVQTCQEDEIFGEGWKVLTGWQSLEVIIRKSM